MRPRLTVSRSAVELIKMFEGYRAKAARLDDGRWTIGYGHTLTAREGAQVSEPDAEGLLLYDLIHISHAVNERVFAPLNQNQFDALVSFVFNIGERNFRGSTTFRRLNEGRPLEAALAMEMWRKADLEGERTVIDALVRRRAAEKALFLKPVDGWIPAPTPVLPPKFDYDAVGVMPMQAPVATRAPMAGDRAFAERAPEPAVEEPETPSASEAAAAAVIEQLEAILTEPEAEPKAAPPAAPAAPMTEPGISDHVRPSEAPTAGAEAAPLFQTPPAAATRPVNPAAFVALGALGVGLIIAAVLWGFQPLGPLGAVRSVTGGVVTGVVGVVCLSVAVYFLLERVGRPRDRA